MKNTVSLTGETDSIGYTLDSNVAGPYTIDYVCVELYTDVFWQQQTIFVNQG